VLICFLLKKSNLYAVIPVLHLAKTFSKDSFSKIFFPYKIWTNNEREKNGGQKKLNCRSVFS